MHKRVYIRVHHTTKQSITQGNTCLRTRVAVSQRLEGGRLRTKKTRKQKTEKKKKKTEKIHRQEELAILI